MTSSNRLITRQSKSRGVRQEPASHRKYSSFCLVTLGLGEFEDDLYLSLSFVLLAREYFPTNMPPFYIILA